MNSPRFSSHPMGRPSGDRRGVALFLTVGLLAACQTPQQRVVQHEDRLAAAGFVVRPADTPQRQAMLGRLPANRFEQRTRDGAISYVYADPLVCGCLYVGTQRAYEQFKRDQEARHMRNEERMNADMYADNEWNWGEWGYWGPAYGFAGIGW